MKDRVRGDMLPVHRGRGGCRKSAKPRDLPGEGLPELGNPHSFGKLASLLVAGGRLAKGRKIKEMDAHRLSLLRPESGG